MRTQFICLLLFFIILSATNGKGQKDVIKTKVTAKKTFQCTFEMVLDGKFVNLEKSKLSCKPKKPKNQKIKDLRINGELGSYLVNITINPSKIKAAEFSELTNPEPEGCNLGYTRVCLPDSDDGCGEGMFKYCPTEEHRVKASSPSQNCSCLSSYVVSQAVATGVNPLGCGKGCVCLSEELRQCNIDTGDTNSIELCGKDLEVMYEHLAASNITYQIYCCRSDEIVTCKEGEICIEACGSDDDCAKVVVGEPGQHLCSDGVSIVVGGRGFHENHCNNLYNINRDCSFLYKEEYMKICCFTRNFRNNHCKCDCCRPECLNAGPACDAPDNNPPCDNPTCPGQGSIPSGRICSANLTSCYLYYDNYETWEDAEQDCQEKGNGHLVTINSEEENNFVWKNIGVDTYIHLGIYATFTADKGSWTWLSKGGSDYTNWNKGKEPSWEDVIDNRCVYMNINTGFWTNQDCEEGTAYVCEWEL